MASAETAEARRILRNAAASLPPSSAVHDLFSAGVCVCCICRFCGIRDHEFYSSSLTASDLVSFLEEQNTHENDSPKNQQENERKYCCICLGVLQHSCLMEGEIWSDCKKTSSVDDLALAISEIVKREKHQIDGFSLEISLPPVIAANERAIRLYLKQKYENEIWFKDKFLSEHVTVKDALRFLLSKSLESHMGVKSGNNSFRIHMIYTHSDFSQKFQNLLSDRPGCKKREKDIVENGSNKKPHNESDASIYRALDMVQDHDFSQLFQIPPEKADKPCQLAAACYRIPIYIGGRYLKYSRKVSQTCWIIDDERMGEASVEEIIGGNVLQICRGDSYKFHAAGREDIDVRMLGSGRPFLIEVSNYRFIPSELQIQQIAENINNSDKKYVGVRNLKLLGSEAWDMMREGEAEKQKQYAALVWISRPLTDDDLLNISSLKDMEIAQKTPIRVLHRRSPLERKKIIHWMKIEKVVGTTQYFLLHLCTQAGTYIKEFVHGDLGRTHPSVGSIFGCRAEILQLDVTDVKMDYFD